MQIAPLRLEPRVYIAERMREWDRRECFAMYWSDDPAEFAGWVASVNDFAFIAYADDGEPAAAIGAVEIWPGLWQPWAFGTDRFNHVAIGLTRFVRKKMIPAMAGLGWRTAECFSHVGHVESHRWLELTGGKRDRDVPHFGKNGEDFVRFVWYNADKVNTPKSEV
jgi:hypothetical protein